MTIINNKNNGATVSKTNDSGEKLQSCLSMAQQLRNVDNQAIDVSENLFLAGRLDDFESA
jgi:hypothetical protein